MEELTFTYDCMEELCFAIEKWANNTVASNICTDFSTPHADHNCLLGQKTIMKFEFRHKKFFLRITDDYVLFSSTNFAELIGMSELIIGRVVKFEKKMYMSSHHCAIFRPKRLIVVLYNMISDVTILENGSRYPVLFDIPFCGPWKDDIISVKNLSTHSLKEIRFSLHDEAMRPLSKAEFMYVKFDLFIIRCRLLLP